MHEPAAIADSGPLISLARTNQHELLPRLFSKILVPPEVWNEVTVKGQERPGAHEISRAFITPVSWVLRSSTQFTSQHLLEALDEYPRH